MLQRTELRSDLSPPPSSKPLLLPPPRPPPRQRPLPVAVRRWRSGRTWWPRPSPSSPTQRSRARRSQSASPSSRQRASRRRRSQRSSTDSTIRRCSSRPRPLRRPRSRRPSRSMPRMGVRMASRLSRLAGTGVTGSLWQSSPRAFHMVYIHSPRFYPPLYLFAECSDLLCPSLNPPPRQNWRTIKPS